MVYALIVVYNRECSESETINSIYKWKDQIQFAVFDNSTKKTHNQEYCEKEGFLYYSVGTNVGLSKAYNYVIERLPLKEEDYVIVLDDDTELTSAYIEEVLQSVSLKKDILLPVVHSGDMILSPTNIKYKCGSVVVGDVSELNMDYMSAINSGMVVSARVYEQFRYNEALFLDCVDHEFMKSAREHHCSFHLLKNGIVQNFSRDEKPKIESALFRFGLFKKDFKTYCKMNDAMMYYRLSIMKFVLSYTLKYKSLRFMKQWLTNK